MTEFLQLTIANISLAAIYLLIGQGWNLSIAVSGLLNLAIGAFYMFGGMLSYWVAADHGLAPLAAAVVAVAATAALAYVVDRVLLRPAGDRVVVQIIATIGVSLVLMEAAKQFFGVDPVKPAPLAPGDPVRVGSVLIAPQALLVVVVALAVTGALRVFFLNTDTGRAMRACADNPDGARCLGIEVQKQRTIAYTAAGAMAALAGVLIAPLIPITYASGDFIALKAFMGIAIVGLGKFALAPLGALLVASLEGYIAGYWSSDYRDIVVLGLLLAILLAQVLRPDFRAQWRALAPRRPIAQAAGRTGDRVFRKDFS